MADKPAYRPVRLKDVPLAKRLQAALRLAAKHPGEREALLNAAFYPSDLTYDVEMTEEAA